MTDPTPNAPMPEPLSPAAQAVLDAAFSVYDCEALYSLTEEQHASMIVAAALRAIADQVVPEESEPSEEPFADLNSRWPTWYANKKTRRKILAIATELENHQ